MEKRLASDDLEFLNTVRRLGAMGLTESTIAERLGISTEEMGARVTRIRSAFVTLTGLMALATGERPAGASGPWEVVILETAF